MQGRCHSQSELWLNFILIICPSDFLPEDRRSEKTKDLPLHTRQIWMCLRKGSGDPAGFGSNLSEGLSGSLAAPPGLVPGFKRLRNGRVCPTATPTAGRSPSSRPGFCLNALRWRVSLRILTASPDERFGFQFYG